MQCKKCGADLGFGADVCAECGAPVDRPAGAAAPLPEDVVEMPVSEPAPVASSRPTWLVPVVAAIAVLLIAVGGYFVYNGLSGASSPDAAAVRMMNGFANYDAAAILDNATHASLNATDQTTFAKQATDAKKGNNGLTAVKDIKVVKVTIDPKDPNAATVQLSAQWLTDAKTKKYTARTEILTMVKQNGKWLVKLFQ